jgi:glycosyltransferase involved in cell wall biosynthesis
MNSTRPITVISMAYNKATTIERTYKSLRAQTSLDFEWLIVNDGSKDNVKEVVSTFQEDLFPIRFIDKENEGPARTWNRAVQEAQGELLFRVDPDDYVTEDAIEQIISHMHLVYEGNNTCGLVFLTKFEDGVNVGFHPYDKDTLSNFVDYRLIGKATGDRAEVITKAAALEFPWPFIEGEKFILESSFWSPMGL